MGRLLACHLARRDTGIIFSRRKDDALLLYRTVGAAHTYDAKRCANTQLARDSHLRRGHLAPSGISLTFSTAAIDVPSMLSVGFQTSAVANALVIGLGTPMVAVGEFTSGRFVGEIWRANRPALNSPTLLVTAIKLC